MPNGSENGTECTSTQCSLQKIVPYRVVRYWRHDWVTPGIYCCSFPWPRITTASNYPIDQMNKSVSIQKLYKISRTRWHQIKKKRRKDWLKKALRGEKNKNKRLKVDIDSIRNPRHLGLLHVQEVLWRRHFCLWSMQATRLWLRSINTTRGCTPRMGCRPLKLLPIYQYGLASNLRHLYHRQRHGDYRGNHAGQLDCRQEWSSQMSGSLTTPSIPMGSMLRKGQKQQFIIRWLIAWQVYVVHLHALKESDHFHRISSRKK